MASDREGLGLGLAWLGMGLGLGIIDSRSEPDRRSEPNTVRLLTVYVLWSCVWLTI